MSGFTTMRSLLKNEDFPLSVLPSGRFCFLASKQGWKCSAAWGTSYPKACHSQRNISPVQWQVMAEGTWFQAVPGRIIIHGS